MGRQLAAYRVQVCHPMGIPSQAIGRLSHKTADSDCEASNDRGFQSRQLVSNGRPLTFKRSTSTRHLQISRLTSTLDYTISS